MVMRWMVDGAGLVGWAWWWWQVWPGQVEQWRDAVRDDGGMTPVLDRRVPGLRHTWRRTVTNFDENIVNDIVHNLARPADGDRQGLSEPEPTVEVRPINLATGGEGLVQRFEMGETEQADLVMERFVGHGLSDGAGWQVGDNLSNDAVWA